MREEHDAAPGEPAPDAPRDATAGAIGASPAAPADAEAAADANPAPAPLANPAPAPPRRILIVGHVARPEALQAAAEVIGALAAAGVQPVVEQATRAELDRSDLALPAGVISLGDDAGDGTEGRIGPGDVEIAIVLGGDGTILRGAELVRGTRTPLIGVNLGHVGFLAESEKDSIPVVLERILAHDYEVEERLALAVEAERPGLPPASGWALNDVAFEKADRERMIEVVIAVDGEPLESFGCDGVICSTPTGSTAYSFSAGGPVVWPGVEALLAVPISAHALFARPLVVAPDSTLVIDLMDRTRANAVLWCDGRRQIALPPGSRVVVRRADEPVLLARLHDGPFTKRLVDKFRLPIQGWRGEGAAS